MRKFHKKNIPFQRNYNTCDIAVAHVNSNGGIVLGIEFSYNESIIHYDVAFLNDSECK